MRSSTLLKVGDFVRAIVPPSQQSDRTAYGRVWAIENYTDASGTRQWVYVTWYSNDGKPNGDVQKHHADELEEMGE